MKQLLLGLVATFAFGTAFAQSATPVVASTPAANAPVAAGPPADQADGGATAPAPASAEQVFTAVNGTVGQTVPVAKVGPNMSHVAMGLGAAALVAIALSAGGDDDNNSDDGSCPSAGSDCPSSP